MQALKSREIIVIDLTLANKGKHVKDDYSPSNRTRGHLKKTKELTKLQLQDLRNVSESRPNGS